MGDLWNDASDTEKALMAAAAAAAVVGGGWALAPAAGGAAGAAAPAAAGATAAGTTTAAAAPALGAVAAPALTGASQAALAGGALAPELLAASPALATAAPVAAAPTTASALPSLLPATEASTPLSFAPQTGAGPSAMDLLASPAEGGTALTQPGATAPTTSWYQSLKDLYNQSPVKLGKSSTMPMGTPSSTAKVAAPSAPSIGFGTPKAASLTGLPSLVSPSLKFSRGSQGRGDTFSVLTRLAGLR